jgi:hydrogenase expression/formation protein HypE
MAQTETITMAHGSGGRDSEALMRGIFGRHFSNEILNRLEDAAVLSTRGDLVVSTDSFVVTPLIFPGGDIGKLAVCGTVNDVLMMGGRPEYLTCGFILEEGLELATLERIVASMAQSAVRAGVSIIAGDTKVVDGRGASGGGLYINTTGIGTLRSDLITPVGAAMARPGDLVVVSGNLGDHHACILSARMGVDNNIQSDCAVLGDLTEALLNGGVDVHVFRDVTRGGLATVLNEIGAASQVSIQLEEKAIPVDDEVKGFCGVMGLDPIYMGNEGKLVAIVAEKDGARSLSTMRETAVGKDAAIIGQVTGTDPDGSVIMRTGVGHRRVDVLYGEGLPRIC